MSTETVEEVKDDDPALTGEEGGEWERVVAWRLFELTRAGFQDAELAESIARRPRINLHDVCRLLKQGCSPELAARIYL